MQVAISPYHPPTAVTPYTTTLEKSLIFKEAWNGTKCLLVFLFVSYTALTTGAKNSKITSIKVFNWV